MQILLGKDALTCGEGNGNPPLKGLHETRVATREESGVLGFPSRRGLTPRGSLESLLRGDFFSYSTPASHLEKAMAPHSSPLAWRIPWIEEPGRLQSMGSLRIGHD